jgi:hypothetical protein
VRARACAHRCTPCSTCWTRSTATAARCGKGIKTLVINSGQDHGAHHRSGDGSITRCAPEPHLDQLQAKARAANRRLLDTERAGQGCVLASPAFARVAQPSGEAGYRTGALRFGDPRVMALAGALCSTRTGVVGFTHRSLRARVAALLGTAYSPNQMSYDLTRLRRKGLIQRLPGSNTYVLTADGVRFALFYTKVHDQLLAPLLAADAPPALPELRQALGVIDRSVTDYLRQARLEAA